LTVQPKADVWDEVAAEPDLCGRLSCAHYDNCFVFKARREAAMADVVVVNHHLLLADLAVRRSSQNWDDAAVLPSYKRVVIDEGHHLEDAASSHLGVSVTRRALVRLFARLERRGNRGLLPVLAGKLAERSDLMSTASLDLVRDKVTPSVHAARELVQQLFTRLQILLEQTTNGASFRLDSAFDRHAVWAEGLDGEYSGLLREIAAIGDGLRLVRERIEADEERAKELSGPLGELRGVSRRLLSTSDALVHVLRPAPGGGESVRWIECVGRPAPERNVALYSVPLDLAPILKTDLFDRVDTAVITSATLATEGGFEFLKQRLGLAGEQQRVRASAFASPFRYEEQALLVVPTDIPAPNEDPAGHAAMVQRQLRDLATASDGGVFALFTSHRDVRAAAALALASIVYLATQESNAAQITVGGFVSFITAMLMLTAPLRNSDWVNGTFWFCHACSPGGRAGLQR
jgi:ATP-dependent DNA helicase DinG